LDGKAQFIAARQKFTPTVVLEPRDQPDNVRMSTAILSVVLLRSCCHASGSAPVSIYIGSFQVLAHVSRGGSACKVIIVAVLWMQWRERASLSSLADCRDRADARNSFRERIRKRTTTQNH
jgi:hypothetical protein